MHLFILAVLLVLGDRRRRHRGCLPVLWQLGEPRFPSPKLPKVGCFQRVRLRSVRQWRIALADTNPEARKVLHHIQVARKVHHRQLYCTYAVAVCCITVKNEEGVVGPVLTELFVSHDRAQCSQFVARWWVGRGQRASTATMGVGSATIPVCLFLHS